MAYSTQALLAQRMTSDELVALGDIDEDGTADADVIAQAIADADALIDSYVRVRGLAVPLDPVPGVVQSASVTLAHCNLALGRQSMTEDLKNARAEIIKWLVAIAAGGVSLGVDGDHTDAEPYAGAEITAAARVYDRTKMRGW